MTTRFDPATLERIAAPSRRSDMIYQAIRTAILHRRIKRGEWLRETALAEELGVSRTMVRDALSRLVAEGHALEVPYKGVQAATITGEELEEVYTIRARLESWAFELAASCVTPADLDAMRALLPQAVLDPTLREFEKTRVANREFHWIAIRASGKRHLMRLLEQIWDLVPSDLMYPDLEEEVRRRVAASEMQVHQEIVAALERGDGKRAGELVSGHVLGTLIHARPLLEQAAGASA